MVPGRVENLKEKGEFGTEIRTVACRMIEEEKFERFRFEDFGVFGEEAEENTNQEALEGVAGKMSFFELVVEVGEFFDGLKIGGVFGVEFAGLIAGDEGEAADVVGQVFEGEFRGVGIHLRGRRGRGVRNRKRRCRAGLRRRVGVGEMVDVTDGLGVGLGEVLAAGFVFGDERARPEEVNEFILALEVFDGLLKSRDEFPGTTENGEEFVPECLGVRTFARGVLPLLGEANGVMADFVEAQYHG